jgi:hypothetical protein
MVFLPFQTSTLLKKNVCNFFGSSVVQFGDAIFLKNSPESCEVFQLSRRHFKLSVALKCGTSEFAPRNTLEVGSVWWWRPSLPPLAIRVPVIKCDILK